MGVEDTKVVDQLFELAVVLGELMNRRLADSGLTPARAEIIWLLHRRGGMTQRELSQILECTPRNVTGLVDALENAGFVARSRHPTDRRAVLVTLTSRGKSLAADWSADREHGTAGLFAGMSSAEIATFTKVLDHVLAALRAITPQASPSVDDGREGQATRA